MKRTAVAACFVFILSSYAYSEDKSDSETSGETNTNSMFSALGVTERRNISDKSCKIELEIDQKELISAVPMLQKIDMINSDLSQADINSKTVTITMTVAIMLASIETKSVYEAENKIDKCSFKQTMKEIDDFGNDKFIPLFTYNFTRALYNKINWPKFQSTSMMKIAPNFTVNPAIAARMSSEN